MITRTQFTIGVIVEQKLQNQIKTWMQSHVSDYVDCGEIDRTSMGEDAAETFDTYVDPNNDNFDIMPEVWDIAHIVATDWEARHVETA